MLKRGLNKRGQIAIFIVIGLIIIVAVVALFFIRQRLAPQIPTPGVGPSQISLQFEDGIRECVRSSAESAIKVVTETAGDVSEERDAIWYDGERYPYLCIEEQLLYAGCVPQDTYIKGTFEERIGEDINVNVGDCVDGILTDAVENGYKVDAVEAEGAKVRINTGRVEVSYIRQIKVERGREKFEFNEFDISVSSGVDKIIDKIDEIISNEALHGDYDQGNEMTMDSEVRIEKNRVDDSTLYLLESHKELMTKFGVRSYVY